MSNKLQPVRGTHDILPAESIKRRFIENALAGVCARYGYGEIATPVFEFSDVFHRTLGDTSDVVTKETYTFTDRGGESLTLRPEFTASVVRAFISNGLQETLPFKVFYHGPAFRYERPQKGRLRQFHQFGAEILGVADSSADIEMIAMAAHCLGVLFPPPVGGRLGGGHVVGSRSITPPPQPSPYGGGGLITLEINSLGDAESRTNYRSALVAYFNDHKNTLSDDSKTRLEKNPLRILDSKDEGDRKIIAHAPKGSEYFSAHAKEFFAEVQESLGALGIAFTVNPKLVRGLDYYSHTVFEFTTDALGSQGTVLAGGRYDGLVAMMGGHDTPGVGFAAGIERLLALMEVANAGAFPAPQKSFAVVPVDEPQAREALLLAHELRHGGIACELVIRGNMGKKMKPAEKSGAMAVLILGENELQSGEVVVKTLADGKQQTIKREALAAFLTSL